MSQLDSSPHAHPGSISFFRAENGAVSPSATGTKEQERLAILTARRAQMEQKHRLHHEVSQEVASPEERLAFIHDALSLHGHPQVINERIYLTDPLLAELQGLDWRGCEVWLITLAWWDGRLLPMARVRFLLHFHFCLSLTTKD